MLIILVNESADALKTEVSVQIETLGRPGGSVALTDLYTSGSLRVESIAAFTVELPAYGIAVYDVKRDDTHLQ